MMLHLAALLEPRPDPIYDAYRTGWDDDQESEHSAGEDQKLSSPVTSASWESVYYSARQPELRTT